MGAYSAAGLSTKKFAVFQRGRSRSYAKLLLFLFLISFCLTAASNIPSIPERCSRSEHFGDIGSRSLPASPFPGPSRNCSWCPLSPDISFGLRICQSCLGSRRISNELYGPPWSLARLSGWCGLGRCAMSFSEFYRTALVAAGYHCICWQPRLLSADEYPD